MTIIFGALIVATAASVGALWFSSGRDRRRRASIAAITAFLEANPRTRTVAPTITPVNAPREAKIFFLDAYRDRAALLARSHQAIARHGSTSVRMSGHHRPA